MQNSRILLTLILCLMLPFAQAFAQPFGKWEKHNKTARGINFNFYHVDQSLVPSCQALGPNITFANSARLRQYGNPSVRARSQADLRDLVQSGVTWARTMVWFSQSVASKIGFESPNERLKAIENLPKLGRDLKDSGVRVWNLAFGNFGTTSPRCKAFSAGDCFDPSTVPSSVEFVIAARRAIDKAPHPKLRVDLTNEACPSYAGQSPILAANDRAYLVPLIKAYVKAFPDDEITASCIGDLKLPERVDNLYSLFAAAGAKPTFIDAHIYARADGLTAKVAGLAARLAKRKHVPFIIGETNISRPDVWHDLKTGFKSERKSPLAVLAWPLKDPTTGCAADHAESFVDLRSDP